MKSISAVIFPDTVPSAQVLIPLVLVFDPVVYCQPVENDNPCEPFDAFSKKMVANGLCSFHVPAPLEENRERFLHLVNDLHQRRDDYAAQLTHVSLAGLSSGSQPGSESRSSILSRLLSRHGIEEPGREERDKLLWQARLILKLGEQYDADHRNLTDSMQQIHQREQKLFSGLSNETESVFSLTGKLSAPTYAADKMQRLRMKAWARLFSFASSPTPGHHFVTTDPDAVDRLCEQYERIVGKRPEPMLTLPLPASVADPERYLERQQHFSEEEHDLMKELQDALADNSILPGLIQHWEDAVAKTFPRQEYGRSQLVLYSFSAVRKRQLFLDSFGYDENELETALGEEPRQDVLVGLLREL